MHRRRHVSKFLPRRLKQVRLAYVLSTKNLAQFLGIKSGSNITFWETGKQKPSLEALELFCFSFGISVDWLMGYSSSPYNDEFLTLAEEELLSIPNPFNPSLLYLPHLKWIPNEYLDANLRKATYSFPVRANIIFLLHNYLSTSLEAIKTQEQLLGENRSTILDQFTRYYKMIKQAKTAQQAIKQHNLYIQSLHKLLEQKSNAAVLFDITKEFE